MSVDDTVIALTRMLEDDQFNDAVARDAAVALAEYELNDDERNMLAADASARGEVEGFAVTQFKSTKTAQYLGKNIPSITPHLGSALGGAVSRAAGSCGPNGCCPWEGNIC